MLHIYHVREPHGNQDSFTFHTDSGKSKVFTGCYFLCLFGLFTLWYECICDRLDCRQCCNSRAGIFKWNFDHFQLETMWKVMKSGFPCGSCTRLTCRNLIDVLEMWNFQANINCVKCVGIWIPMWLTCTVNVQISDRCTKNVELSSKYFLEKLCKMWRNLDYCVAPYTQNVQLSDRCTRNVELSSK